MRDGEFRQVDVFVQGLETAVEIHGPFAGNIVRDLDVTNFAAFEKRRDYVISIYISKIYIVINVDSENSR